MAVEVIEGIVESFSADKEFNSGVNALGLLATLINGPVLMFGRQNDAGVSGLSRFNPFTNIKIAFCKTA